MLASSMTISLISGSANIIKNIVLVTASQSNQSELSKELPNKLSKQSSNSAKTESSEQNQNELQKENDKINKTIDDITNKIGLVSFIMFIAFSLSGVAAVFGAICSRRKFKNEARQNF